jgi:hypothetical protein
VICSRVNISTEPIKREDDSTEPHSYPSLVERSNKLWFGFFHALLQRLRAPVPAAERGRHPASSPDVLCLLCRPCGTTVPLRLRVSSLLVRSVPCGRELAHQPVLRTGSHPLHIDLEQMKHEIFVNMGSRQMVFPQRKEKKVSKSQTI